MPRRAQPPQPATGGRRETVPLGETRVTTATIYGADATPAASQSEAASPLLVLAHGAGAGQTHPFMTAIATGLAGRGIDVVTFDFPYVHERRGAPDRAPVLEACFASVIEWVLAQPSLRARRLFIGGKSMGGRMATHLGAAGFAARGGAGAAVPISGIIALGYPLHPPGKPEQLRVAHLPAIAAPVLIVQGSRDAFGTPEELAAAIATLPAPVTVHVVSGGDHSFTVSRTPKAEIMDSLVDVVATWIDSVPAPK